MKKVAFHNLGCKVNSYEFEIMQQNIQKRGFEIVQFTQKADVYVVNTCSVTNIADRKSRQMLHKAKKLNPDAVVVAVGCYAQTRGEEALKDEAIDIIIGNNRKADIADIITEYMKERDNNFFLQDLSIEADYEECGLDTSSERNRVDVKIQDGCNQFCSYCIIPFARGRIRSRKLDNILEEVNRLAKQGFREIVLTGIHLSSYGLDFIGAKSYNEVASSGTYTNHELMEVIKKVSEVEGITRIRLGSLEPRVITEEFLEFISSNKKVCPHFHLSLQSGCDETLKRMNRHYTAQEYLEGVNLIRKYYNHPAITTDIIVGFPGETEEEFKETCNFVDQVRFYETHIFKYSKREGTVAAKMPNQLTEAQKTSRSAVLLEKNAANSKAFRDELIGTEVEILAEESLEYEGKAYTRGYTMDYINAAVEGEYTSNTSIKGIVKGFLTEEMLLIEKP